jgi:hypothetical protein
MLTKHNCKPNGIIHVGAHLAEEKEIYDKLSVPVLWIEADKE